MSAIATADLNVGEELATKLTVLDGRRHRLLLPEVEEVKGIWDGETALFARYLVSIRFTGYVMGGTPQRPDIIEGWLRTKAGVTDDEELRAMVVEQLRQLGKEVSLDTPYEDLVAASKAVASEKHGNTFPSDHRGLIFEGRKLKAGLKESTNILFAGDRWGKTKKGPKSYLAERVFVDEDRLPLGKVDPDGTYLQLGQVTGPQGPRSTLTYYDYVFQPALTFTVLSTEDCVSLEQWKAILVHLQENGLGALRSQGFGRFKVVGFEKLSEAAPLPQPTGTTARVQSASAGEETTPATTGRPRATDAIKPGVSDKHAAGSRGVGHG